MNPDRSDDWVDEALRSRGAMTAPSHFTPTVMRRVGGEAPLSQFVMEHGPRLGLTLAILGLGLILDVNRLGLLLQQGPPAASTLVLTMAALCAVLLGLSITADEPI